MARIIQKDRPGEGGKKKLAWVLFGMVAVCAVMFFIGILQQSKILILAGGIGAVIFISAAGAAGNFRGKTDDILQAGLAGEQAAAELIAAFPDSYLGFQNLRVTYGGKTSELDMVVVGAAGVFVIETKNLKGRICGGYEQERWTQHKTGRAGGSYEKQLYSPVRQVGTHVYRLAHYLRSHGMQLRVDAMVYFTDPRTSVEITGTSGEIPVFSGKNGGKDLTRHILKGKAVLSPQEVRRLCHLLEKCK